MWLVDSVIVKTNTSGIQNFTSLVTALNYAKKDMINISEIVFTTDTDELYIHVKDNKFVIDSVESIETSDSFEGEE